MDLDTLRNICLAYPGTTEEVQWEEHLLFKVAGKMFCITNLKDAGDTAFKVADEDFEELSNSATFIAAPHLARAKWIKVVQPRVLKVADWKRYIAASYELVKARLPKKVQAGLSTL